MIKHSPTEEELLSPITRARVLELLYEAGADGLTFPEMIDIIYPGLDAHECERLTAILEYAMTGHEADYGRVIN
jgi:hypothetical protein